MSRVICGSATTFEGTLLFKSKGPIVKTDKYKSNKIIVEHLFFCVLFDISPCEHLFVFLSGFVHS